MGAARSTALLLATLAAASCDLLKGKVTEEDDTPEPPAAVDEGETVADPTLRVRPLERAERKMRFIGKGAEHLGWKMTTLATMYGLAGAVEVPEWGAPGDGDWRATRDDDLATAWTCEHTKAKPCAFGIHFPTPAHVRAVRVHVSAHLTDDPSAYARVKTLRVHTDEGWAEGHLEPDYLEQYVILGEEIETTQLTVEIAELHHGPAKVRVAELEVFGSSGEKRSPLTIDPLSTFVRLGQPVWKKSAGEYFPASVPRLQYFGEGSTPHILAAGTAAYGVPGDRFVLLENVVRTKCRSHLGDYILLDLLSRVQVPLGDLGGLPGMVFRADNGLGFAAGYVDEDETRVHGVVWEDDRYQRKKSPRVMKTTYHELFEEWGIDETPLPRGGFPIEDPDETCSLATDQQFDRLQAARARGIAGDDDKKSSQKRTKLGGPADRWLSCGVGATATMFVSTGGTCGKAWEVALVDGEELIARELGTSKGARARVRRRSRDEVLVEVGSADDDVVTYRVSAGAIESLGPSTALALTPPRQCRDHCDDSFANPRAP